VLQIFRSLSMTPYLAALDRRGHHRSRRRHRRVARASIVAPESTTNNPLKRNAAGATSRCTDQAARAGLARA
jgi:hypothetical protein